MDKIEKKRLKEQRVVVEMINLYCRHNHKDKYNGCMCEDCQALADYAVARSEKCPFMEHKTFCANCTVHCYNPKMRAEIKKVMRYSGPRMLFYHPLLAIWHVVCSIREKRKLKKVVQ